jgi:hypothetical protein
MTFRLRYQVGMQTQTRRLLPVLGAVGVGVCLCVAAIVTLGAQRPRSIGLESSSAEHAAENSFFDSLAARDLAKDRKSRNAKDALGSHKALSASQARTLANSYFKHVGEAPVGHQATAHAGARKVPAKHWKPLPASALVHFSKFKGMHQTGGAAKPAVGKKGHGIASMRAEFAKAQEQLKQEKSKMRHMEEKDKVRAASPFPNPHFPSLFLSFRLSVSVSVSLCLFVSFLSPSRSASSRECNGGVQGV